MRHGGLCTCRQVRYRATSLLGGADPRTVGPAFDSLAEARAWQQGQDQSRGEGGLTGFRITDLIDDFLHAAERGDAEAPWGSEYTQGQLRELRGALSYADVELGTYDVREVSRRRVQSLVDELADAGLSEARLSSLIAALQALYGYAVSMGIVDHTPIVELALPDLDRDRSHDAMPRARRDGAFEAATQAMPVAEAVDPPEAGIVPGAEHAPSDESATGHLPPGGPPTPGVPTPPFGPPPTHLGQNGYPTPGVYFPPGGYQPTPPYPTPEGYPTGGYGAPTGYDGYDPNGYATPNGYGAQPRHTTPYGYAGYPTAQGFPTASGYPTPGQPTPLPPWAAAGTGQFPSTPGTG
ncbi:MAG: hypothetical protein QOH08_646, partial [Chloroflexota bacterium]|nr:hypothetical protein [Chloroflexota bacterium]